jgi:hypothetical protein
MALLARGGQISEDGNKSKTKGKPPNVPEEHSKTQNVHGGCTEFRNR